LWKREPAFAAELATAEQDFPCPACPCRQQETVAHLGVLTAPSAEARATQLQLGLDLTAVNADTTTTVPMPTTVILDADRVRRWIDIHPDYSTRTEPTEVLHALDRIGL
jgi:hypothetical protein